MVRDKSKGVNQHSHGKDLKDECTFICEFGSQPEGQERAREKDQDQRRRAHQQEEVLEGTDEGALDPLTVSAPSRSAEGRIESGREALGKNAQPGRDHVTRRIKADCRDGSQGADQKSIEGHQDRADRVGDGDPTAEAEQAANERAVERASAPQGWIESKTEKRRSSQSRYPT